VHLLVNVQNKKKNHNSVWDIVHHLGFLQAKLYRNLMFPLLQGPTQLQPPRSNYFQSLIYMHSDYGIFLGGINTPVLYTEILWLKPPLRDPNQYKPLNLIMETDSVYKILCL